MLLRQRGLLSWLSTLGLTRTSMLTGFTRELRALNPTVSGFWISSSSSIRFRYCQNLELEIEYSWKRRHQPEFLTGIDSFDKYMEMLARMLYFSLDSYMRALKEWANGGRPTELADCLQNAERQSLLRFKRVQARRTKDKEQSYMKCQRARAPAHLLARIEAGIHRENLALHLIGQSLSSL